MEKSHKSLVKYIIIVLLIQVYRDVHFVPIQWCYLHIPLQCGSIQQLLRWQVSLSAEVNKNVNLGYSQDQVYSQFQGWGFLQGKIALPNIISGFISSLIHIHDLKIPTQWMYLYAHYSQGPNHQCCFKSIQASFCSESLSKSSWAHGCHYSRNGQLVLHQKRWRYFTQLHEVTS